MRRRDLLALGATALSLRSPMLRSARAQSKYPDRPIRLVIPFPPGGGYDAVGRPWAEKMKPVLGTVVVENQGGGGSSLGAASVARARPDGYTILLGGSSTHITEPFSKAIHSTIRLRTSSRFRTWQFRLLPLRSIPQCRLTR
ncbi:MAG: hypothetical protein E6G80_05360 [Alphaproteobacteria bacterium]|nr:MAG: hypothetical protein E6G80_05360 [Alphaproteobacteria bacterium]